MFFLFGKRLIKQKPLSNTRGRVEGVANIRPGFYVDI